MAMVAPQQQFDKKRVKVYELKENDWFDRGTGFCKGDSSMNEAKILVDSEEEPARILLETIICKEAGYQKQQDTLIVWTERNGTDMALSFQEAEGCAAIWDFVSTVSQHLMSLDDALSDDTIDPFAQSQPFGLPPPELGNLSEVEQIIRAAASSPAGRDQLAKLILGDGYILKLIPLVETAEDLEDLEDLHKLCNIMKTLILLNDNTIIEHVVTDDLIIGVVGALEYDPDFPSHKANHRQYLADKSKFKEVVRINDENIQKKIHHTWRLQYLKDVVLARILDDPTFSVLNSLIFFNQVDIVTHLQQNAAFLKELFGIFENNNEDDQRKQDAVHFIQQCCAITKNLQLQSRTAFYNNLIQAGLFTVVTYALRHSNPSIRSSGTDILVALLDHDPTMMRGYMYKALQDRKPPLTDTLIDLLLIEEDLGVKQQLADSIKVLLDPLQGNPNQPSELRQQVTGDFLSKMRGNVPGTQMDSFLQMFYEESSKKLFKPLKELEGRTTMDDLSFREVSLFVNLVDILNYFIRQHMYRSRFLMVEEGLASRVAQILTAPQKHLKLMALKFFRTLVQLSDPFYVTLLITTTPPIFSLVLDIVTETMPRDNLLNSSCLEFFEFIKRENAKPLLKHLVETYRERLEEITYVDTFRTMIERYEGMRQNMRQYSNGEVAWDSDEIGGVPMQRSSPQVMTNGGRWSQGVKEMDSQEEEYFNTSDDEDELAVGGTTTNMQPADGPQMQAQVQGQKTIAISTTPSPLLQNKPLVPYPADDDSSNSDSDHENHINPTVSFTTSPTADSPQQTQKSHTRSPPERLSEKRRREDDDDDELGKLVGLSAKRRSSTSSAGSSPTTSPNANVAPSPASNARGERRCRSSSPASRSSSGGALWNNGSLLKRKDSKQFSRSAAKGGKIAISLGGTGRKSSSTSPDGGG
ncbi:MAG: Platinum sensitivity protein [Cirrosporium novae-zelandiae]|nr:MAG: Platinum sensitivity protein [Cirrosporium novae-zelandiae]